MSVNGAGKDVTVRQFHGQQDFIYQKLTKRDDRKVKKTYFRGNLDSTGWSLQP